MGRHIVSIEKLKTVIDESLKLGARSLTYSRQGPQTLRIHLEPERDHIKNLTVFLAHTTADKDWADTICRDLRDLGFRVIYLPADETVNSQHMKTEEEIQILLSNSIDKADYLCMLFSKNSAAREWVRFEYKLAARLIGRVVMVKDSSVETIDDFQIPRFERQALLTVKYQIVEYSEKDKDFALKLGRVIINDPDGGALVQLNR